MVVHNKQTIMIKQRIFYSQMVVTSRNYSSGGGKALVFEHRTVIAFKKCVFVIWDYYYFKYYNWIHQRFSKFFTHDSIITDNTFGPPFVTAMNPR